MKTFLRRYPFSILLILLITYLSLFRPPKTDLDEINNFDKFVHFGMYFFLSSLLWIEFFKAHKQDNTPLYHAWLGAFVFPIIYSGVVELLQAYGTSYRSGDWGDFIANSLGVFVGSIVCYWIVKRRFYES